MLSPQLTHKAHEALVDPKVSDEIKAKIHELIQSDDEVSEDALDKVISGA